MEKALRKVLVKKPLKGNLFIFRGFFILGLHGPKRLRI
jgi:hypothetical protein